MYLEAIAATSDEMRMYVPPLQAVAPMGETKTQTGTLDSSIAVIILCTALASPPGVSIMRTTSRASIPEAKS